MLFLFAEGGKSARLARTSLNSDYEGHVPENREVYKNDKKLKMAQMFHRIRWLALSPRCGWITNIRSFIL